MILIVDRVEEGYAVCLDDAGASCSLPLSFFPSEVKEQDAFELTLIPRPEEKRVRSERARGLLEKLKRKGQE